MSIERMTGPTGADAPVQPLPPRASVQRDAPPAPPAPTAPPPAVAPGAAALKVTVDSVNRYLKSIDQGVQFEIDEESGVTIVRVVDRETDQVIRQLPSEEMLAVARALEDLTGLLDESA